MEQLRQLIQIAGSSACQIPAITTGTPVPVGKTYTIVNNNGTNATNAFGPCTITVSVVDFKLYLCRAHVTNAYVPRSITQTIALKQWCPYRYSLSAGTSNTILAPMKQNRRITHIIIAFTQNAQTPFKSSPTDFSSGFTEAFLEEENITTDGMSLIQNVSITIGGVTHPRAVYNLTSNSTNTNVQ